MCSDPFIQGPDRFGEPPCNVHGSDELLHASCDPGSHARRLTVTLQDGTVLAADEWWISPVGLTDAALYLKGHDLVIDLKRDVTMDLTQGPRGLCKVTGAGEVNLLRMGDDRDPPPQSTGRM